MTVYPAVSFVFGGASSGKSSFAERLARSAAQPKTYIATAQAYDAEMEAKIEAHQAERASDGWTTSEEPLDLAAALDRIEPDHIVLIDCATMWLNNLVMADHDIRKATDALQDAMHRFPGPIVIVSNETGQGIVPENALARRFRVLQGGLNCRLAAAADLVVEVKVGLPLVLKGRLPEALR